MKEALYDDYMAAVTFTDDDLLLGTTEHNRPLYVTGTSQGTTINRILINLSKFDHSPKISAPGVGYTTSPPGKDCHPLRRIKSLFFRLFRPFG